MANTNVLFPKTSDTHLPHCSLHFLDSMCQFSQVRSPHHILLSLTKIANVSIVIVVMSLTSSTMTINQQSHLGHFHVIADIRMTSPFYFFKKSHVIHPLQRYLHKYLMSDHLKIDFFSTYFCIFDQLYDQTCSNSSTNLRLAVIIVRIIDSGSPPSSSEKPHSVTMTCDQPIVHIVPSA